MGDEGAIWETTKISPRAEAPGREYTYIVMP